MAKKEKILQRARKLVERGSLDRAINEYRAAIDADPADISIRLRLCDLLVKAGRNEEAVKEYMDVARANTRRGFYLKAIAVYKQILKLQPENTEIHYKLADLYAKQRLIADAMGQYTIILNIFERKGLERETGELLQKMVELDPKNVSIRLKLTEYYRKNNFKDDAVALYSAIVDELVASGNMKRAAEVCEALQENFPDHAGALEKVAEFYKKAGEDDRFIRFARLLAEKKAAGGDSAGAATLMREILELRPEDRKAREFLEEVGEAAGAAEGTGEVSEGAAGSVEEAEEAASAETVDAARALEEEIGPGVSVPSDGVAGDIPSEGLSAEAGEAAETPAGEDVPAGVEKAPEAPAEDEIEEEIEIDLEGFEEAASAVEAAGPDAAEGQGQDEEEVEIEIPGLDDALQEGDGESEGGEQTLFDESVYEEVERLIKEVSGEAEGPEEGDLPEETAGAEETNGEIFPAEKSWEEISTAEEPGPVEETFSEAAEAAMEGMPVESEIERPGDAGQVVEDLTSGPEEGVSGSVPAVEEDKTSMIDTVQEPEEPAQAEGMEPFEEALPEESGPVGEAVAEMESLPEALSSGVNAGAGIAEEEISGEGAASEESAEAGDLPVEEEAPHLEESGPIEEALPEAAEAVEEGLSSEPEEGHVSGPAIIEKVSPEPEEMESGAAEETEPQEEVLSPESGIGPEQGIETFDEGAGEDESVEETVSLESGAAPEIEKEDVFVDVASEEETPAEPGLATETFPEAAETVASEVMPGPEGSVTEEAVEPEEPAPGPAENRATEIETEETGGVPEEAGRVVEAEGEAALASEEPHLPEAGTEAAGDAAVETEVAVEGPSSGIETASEQEVSDQFETAEEIVSGGESGPVEEALPEAAEAVEEGLSSEPEEGHVSGPAIIEKVSPEPEEMESGAAEETEPREEVLSPESGIGPEQGIETFDEGAGEDESVEETVSLESGAAPEIEKEDVSVDVASEEETPAELGLATETFPEAAETVASEVMPGPEGTVTEEAVEPESAGLEAASGPEEDSREMAAGEAPSEVPEPPNEEPSAEMTSEAAMATGPEEESVPEKEIFTEEMLHVEEEESPVPEKEIFSAEAAPAVDTGGPEVVPVESQAPTASEDYLPAGHEETSRLETIIDISPYRDRIEEAESARGVAGRLLTEPELEEAIQDLARASSTEAEEAYETYEELKAGIEKQLSVEDAGTHYKLGLEYMEMELYREASREFKIALMDPAYEYDCYRRLADCSVSESNYEEGIIFYLKALKIFSGSEPERLELLYNLAIAYEKAGHVQEAGMLMKSIYESDPNFRDSASRVEKLKKLKEQIPMDDPVFEVELL